MKAFKLKYNRKRGFSLVETLVALSIFSLSILAVMTLLGNGISDIGYAKKKMTATYLAQEGIEYFRNMRDTYSISGFTDGVDGWTDFKNKISVCYNNAGVQKACYFQTEKIFNGTNSIFDIDIYACGEDQCPYMTESDGGGYESDLSAPDSGFIREISVQDISEDEIKVVSTVYWTQKSGLHQITFTNNLLNWIE